ncbi:MAG: NUDIX domain-containing protein [Gammaproteobacteria bacterium]
MDKTFGVDDVKVFDEKILYKGLFGLKKITLSYRLFDGAMSDRIERECFTRPDAAAVLLYDPNLQKVVLIEQFRVGALGYPDKSPWLFEIVAGIFDSGENAEAVVVRESQEEAGLVIEKLESVAQYFPSPGATKEFLHVYCGKVDASEAGGIYGLAEEHENIRVHVVDCQEAFNMVKQNKITTASTIVALQWLQLNQAWLDKHWCHK